MKKIVLFLAAASLLLTAVCAGAESVSSPFDQLSGRVFLFSSGAGAWYTELVMGDGGTFTGDFHDSEMGETGEGYPDGSVYGCTFHGRLSDPVKTDEFTWTAAVTVEMDEGQVPEVIEEGIRYVTSAPYGLEKAETVTLYLPGVPLASLPEDLLFWTHLQETDPEADTLPYYAIWSEADAAGFVSDPASEAQDSGLSPSL